MRVKKYSISIKIVENDSSHKFAKNGIARIFETRQNDNAVS